VNFIKVVTQVVGALEQAGVRYATIGGFAMALRGVQRATVDLDFILMLEDLSKADAIFRRFGYTTPAPFNPKTSRTTSRPTATGAESTFSMPFAARVSAC
jgi:hypothetical protein